MTTSVEVPVAEIVWREDLYPRFEPNPAIPEAGSVKIGNKIHLNLDSATFGNCPEQLKSLYAGYIESGIIYVVGSVAKYFYLAYRDSLENNDENESTLRDDLARKLKAQGWTAEKESYTSQGRVDILARRQEEVRIIEIKKRADSNSVAHALGQLLFYSKFHPGATLWFYSPEKPDLTVMSILNSFGVQYLEVN